jgi:hypothetical protein
MRAPLMAILLALFALDGWAAFATWPDKPYVEVRAYAYNRNGDPDRPILKNRRLDPSVVNKRGIVLTPEQARHLIAAVTGKRPQPRWSTACFNPRHAFVFYDTARKPVAWIELCFECGNAAGEPRAPDQVYDIPALEDLARELKLPLVPK